MASDVSAFRQVSMRGRVAYAIMCLEEAILQVAAEPGDWIWLLERLWKYTSADSLDLWQEETAEITPSVVLRCETYTEGDFDRLTEDDFWSLRRVYSSTDPLLARLTDLVFDIGTLELFGAIEDGAPESLRSLDAVLMLMKAHSLRAPSARLVSESSFDSCHGWGSPFLPGGLSRMIQAGRAHRS